MTAKARITAIDRFIKGCREDGIYDDLNACCVMAGWDSLAGALTPLKGTAPTNSGLSNYDRGIGIAGDAASHLNANRANDVDPQDDKHLAVWMSKHHGRATTMAVIGCDVGTTGNSHLVTTTTNRFYRINFNTGFSVSDATTLTGLWGASRNAASTAFGRYGEQSVEVTDPSRTPVAAPISVFARGSVSFSDATLAFYSIGSSLGSDPATGLAALDARVSTLMADLRAIEEAGFDRDAIGYLRAVEEADGAFLETDVKVAINNLVTGLKADGLWESMASTCLLCGPRTLAGALVPLKGDAPTSYGFVEGDFDREGLAGDGTSYLDSNRANDADPQNDNHNAAWVTAAGNGVLLASSSSLDGQNYIDIISTPATRLLNRNNGTPSLQQVAGAAGAGLYGASRSVSTAFAYRTPQGSGTKTADSETTDARNVFVYARSDDGVTVSAQTTATIAFYSIGTSLDLAKLDSHISSYVTAIGAAI